MLTGFKRAYKGKVVQEVYTQPTQTDFGAELTQIRGAAPAAVFTFMPGGAGISFIKQWTQAGLRGTLPLYSVYTVDHSTLKAMGEDALGTLGVSQYVEDLPNERNKAFVAAYTAKYKVPPSEYSAQAYDTAALIDSAVRKVGGKVEDREAMLKALREADFPSVRGAFRFNRNQFPIQNYYLRETVKRPDGGLGFVTKELAAKDYEDAYAGKCTLK
jgi:branched-chain amino acid transport system substrate-binding protein